MKRAPATGLALLALLLAGAGWAALAPLPDGAREALYVIPRGTWSRRMAGESLDILPQELRLELGVRDILVLRNDDDLPQVFGPVLVMPGQRFTMPFRQAATYQFACTLHVTGQLFVIVQEAPGAAWQRLRKRLAGVGSGIAWL